MGFVSNPYQLKVEDEILLMMKLMTKYVMKNHIINIHGDYDPNGVVAQGWAPGGF